MCGIAGYLNLRPSEPPTEELLRRMLAMIRHRGPDQFGIYLDDHVGLGNARLSIIDLAAGQQPITTEDGRYWIVYNGELFNHAELREDLLKHGHRFETHCDTEVFLHYYEQEGPDCLRRFNGQFGVAIWDTERKELFLARDRVGVRPLHYAVRDGVLVFGSEIKAMAVHPAISLELDPLSLDQIFTGWSCLAPRTPFQGIQQLPAGHYALIRPGREIELHRWWQPDFSGAQIQSASKTDTAPQRAASVSLAENNPSDTAYLDELRHLLTDATRLRLLADVPVGAYLSGGLDSSIIAALTKGFIGKQLDTFSIAFTDAAFDERDHQQRMARHLGTAHQVVEAAHKDIGEIFPEVVWHCEAPILRTSPAPMYLLSRLVRKSGYKVVLTGEGADEFLGGYDIFKEAKIRAFWSRFPASTRRSKLFQRIYPDLQNLTKSGPQYLASFFGERLADTESPDYSHLIRWRNTRRTQRFFSPELTGRIRAEARPLIDEVPIPPAFKSWGTLDRAQYVEMVTFLSTYLLSSQGDRVGMANSIEGRFPFLDYRVAEFAMRLPSRLRMPALRDKFLLRRLGAELLPDEIWNRPKKPYRAPIHRSFFHQHTPDYVTDLMSDSALRTSGLFNPLAVAKLVSKITHDQPVGETDDMALAGILSTQLLHHFCHTGFRAADPLSSSDDVKVCDHRTAAQSGR
ncbi:asparagine synthase (glutamine-hydrolyzing) [bacterium]|nr:asparagine synthase (glutamine-hydrolyzing) [bacterium]